MTNFTRREMLLTAGAGVATLSLASLSALGQEAAPKLYTLPKLPYATDALEPSIDAKTMQIHHDKHHMAYVDLANKALAKHPDLLAKPVEVLLADIKSVPEGIRQIVINGAKRWCTGADFSDYIYCLVRSDPEAPARQALSFVLIPTNAPGVTITPIDHVNLRYTLSSDVHFDEVRLPASAIVGGPERWNQGWKMLAGRALDIEKLEISACAFGIAQAALDEAWRYAQDRVQFGKPISGHQAVRHALVDAKTKLEACRLMLWNAARLADAGQPCAAETSMAKLFIAETGVEIALTCQKVMGAYAMSADYDIERNVRDLLGMPIVGGSSNMQRNNLAALWKLPG